MRRQGFTLVEVLVALVVMEVGLLGVVGTLYLAAVTLARAERTERGVARLERLYDSLVVVPYPAAGVVEDPSGTARWWVEGDRLRLEFSAAGDSASVVVEAALGGGGGE